MCVNLLKLFQYFNQLRQTIINTQLPDKQSIMAEWFDSLMDGIERNLQTKNRERYFTFTFEKLCNFPFAS